jgi:hypothetical protein
MSQNISDYIEPPIETWEIVFRFMLPKGF